MVKFLTTHIVRGADLAFGADEDEVISFLLRFCTRAISYTTP
jgi:hypothetical protein